MTIRAEVEELVKWISEMSAKQEDSPTPTTPPRNQWDNAAVTLRRAAQKLGKAARLLTTSDPPQEALAELAGDLDFQAEDLALRAHMLGRRADPPPHKKHHAIASPVATAPRDASGGCVDEGAEQPRGAQPVTGTTASDETVAREQQEHNEELASENPADLVGSAGNSIETVRKKLEVLKPPDHATRSFELALDVLAEMTLRLRQKCERLDPTAAARKR